MVDSNGVPHKVYMNRIYNVENIVFCTATAWCSSSICAHNWLTLGAIARRHSLAHDGQHNGLSLAARLEHSWKEAAQLTRPELLHIFVVSCDFFFAVRTSPILVAARQSFMPLG